MAAHLISSQGGIFTITDFVNPTQNGNAAIVVEEVAAAAPTTWVVERFAVEDSRFKLRVGAKVKWSYEARETIKSDECDIVMTMKVGDTIKVERLASSSSRSMVEHAFTIMKLGIDIPFQPGDRLEPYDLLLDKVGD